MKKSYHINKTKFWGKHLRKVGKRLVNKQTRREVKEFYKEYFESFVGVLKGKGNPLVELMQEKKSEKEL